MPRPGHRARPRMWRRGEVGSGAGEEGRCPYPATVRGLSGGTGAHGRERGPRGMRRIDGRATWFTRGRGRRGLTLARGIPRVSNESGGEGGILVVRERVAVHRRDLGAAGRTERSRTAGCRTDRRRTDGRRTHGCRAHVRRADGRRSDGCHPDGRRTGRWRTDGHPSVPITRSRRAEQGDENGEQKRQHHRRALGTARKGRHVRGHPRPSGLDGDLAASVRSLRAPARG